jgi:hypothetical protein
MREPRLSGLPKGAQQRIPITVTLDPDHYAFLESCVELREFDSVDDIFAAALVLYRKHVKALEAYAEEQSHKGYTRAELLACIECETFVTTRPKGRRGRQRTTPGR